MKDMKKIKELKEKFDRGEISQEEIDIETQRKIANLYREEIEEIRKDIDAIREEERFYDESIANLEEMIKEKMEENNKKNK